MGFFGRLVFALIALAGYGLVAFLWHMQHTARTPHDVALLDQWMTGMALGTTGLLVVWRWICGGARS